MIGIPVGKREGPAYDLPIAIAILAAAGQVPTPSDGCLFLGELSLDGSLRRTAGILPMVALARDRGLTTVFVPALDALEAALVEGVAIYAPASLAELVNHLRGDSSLAPFTADAWQQIDVDESGSDFADIKGQHHVKRALEVAAAGGHNVLLAGPPGTGKTLLTRALPSILPRLSRAEALEATKIYSVCGLLPPEQPLVRQRPFRAPHHTISAAGLVGGGRWPRPGEISLAHRGVLFLDEMPEFGTFHLELLRQPLEDGTVTIARAQGSVTFPAKFILVGAMNPCPCGYYSDPQRACTCSETMISRYQKKLSGPLIDGPESHSGSLALFDRHRGVQLASFLVQLQIYRMAR
jgi:magnesium chelatase family protein